MDLHLLIDNLTNPALLFFCLGLLAIQLKSNLELPESSSKFFSFSPYKYHHQDATLYVDYSVVLDINLSLFGWLLLTFTK